MIDIWNEKALLIIGPRSVQRTFLNCLYKAKWDQADSKLSLRRLTWTKSMANRECESFTDLIKADCNLICFNLLECDIQTTFNYVAQFQEFKHNKVWKLVFWLDIEDGTLENIGATGLLFTQLFDLLVLSKLFYK